MKIFHYTQTANQAGMKSLPALIICGGLIAWFFYNWLNSKSKPLDNSDYIMMVALISVLAIAGSSVLKRINATGSWDISIQENLLEWSAPDGFEKSFVLNLDQIAELRHTINLTNNEDDYVILTKKGDEISLNEDSGIDLETFTDALVSQGVTLNEIDETVE